VAGQLIYPNLKLTTLTWRTAILNSVATAAAAAAAASVTSIAAVR
jgi:hypothetical protein